MKKIFALLVLAACINDGFATDKVSQKSLSASDSARASKPKDEILTAKVYSRKDRSNPLFTFERIVRKEGNYTYAEASYRYPDGRLAYIEKYQFEGKNLLVHEYDQKQVGDLAQIELRDGRIFYTFTEEGKTKKADEEQKGILILPMTIAPTVQENWNKLMAGESIETRLMLAERLETVGFSFKKKKEIDYKGRTAVVIQMKPTSFIIAAMVEPLLMTFEKEGERRLLETDGRLPLREPKYNPPKKRSDWKAMDAVWVADY